MPDRRLRSAGRKEFAALIGRICPDASRFVGPEHYTLRVNPRKLRAGCSRSQRAIQRSI